MKAFREDRLIDHGLEGRVALVTGGASGIGRASAMAFARSGARVVVSEIDLEGGEEIVRLISGLRRQKHY